ncbi:MAG: DNRLRE domain-containing protein [Pirellulales bacterium]
MRWASFLVVATAFFLGRTERATAAVVNLAPNKDNTLIQQTLPASQLSNGQGDIFVGRTNQDGQGPATISIRRGLLAFDVASSVPAGSVVTAVTLTMRDVMGLNGDPTVELHRVSQDWGEGSSFQNGGMGAAAQTGDATWLYRFFNVADPTSSPAWTTPGGDFSAAVSASSIISDDLGSGQLFSWTSAQMVVDVQGWLDNPASNFGWLLFGNEAQGQTAKRLNSGESTIPPNLAPLLQIEYLHVPEPGGFALGAFSLAALALGKRRARRRV